MKKFEYQIVSPDDLVDPGVEAVDVLNDLGDDGWQLVHVAKSRQGYEKWTLMRERAPGTRKPDRRVG